MEKLVQENFEASRDMFQRFQPSGNVDKLDWLVDELAKYNAFILSRCQSREYRHFCLKQFGVSE